MIDPSTTKRMLLYEWIGFGLVILVLWFNELLDLPHLILGSPATPINLGELLIETALIIPLAILVTRLTAQLLRRVKHLEGMLQVCGFCKRVRDGDRWVTLEEYVEGHSQAELMQSLCRDCLLEHFAGGAAKPSHSD
jgi:hypothetical protein